MKQAWREAVAHYHAVENLTPEQKAIAQQIKNHLDSLLDVAKKNGLLEYGARNYVRHLYEKGDAQDLLRLIDNSGKRWYRGAFGPSAPPEPRCD